MLIFVATMTLVFLFTTSVIICNPTGRSDMILFSYRNSLFANRKGKIVVY